MVSLEPSVRPRASWASVVRFFWSKAPTSQPLAHLGRGPGELVEVGAGAAVQLGDPRRVHQVADLEAEQQVVGEVDPEPGAHQPGAPEAGRGEDGPTGAGVARRRRSEDLDLGVDDPGAHREEEREVHQRLLVVGDLAVDRRHLHRHHPVPLGEDGGCARGLLLGLLAQLVLERGLLGQVEVVPEEGLEAEGLGEVPGPGDPEAQVLGPPAVELRRDRVERQLEAVLEQVHLPLDDVDPLVGGDGVDPAVAVGPGHRGGQDGEHEAEAEEALEADVHLRSRVR